MSTLNVESSPSFRVTQDQTTWAVFVTRVILDDGAALNSFFYLFPRDVPQNALIGRMQGILVLLPLHLAANLFDHSRPGT